MIPIKIFLDVYDGEQDKNPKTAVLGYMNFKDKENFLSKLTSAKFIEQSCFSDVQYTLISQHETHFERNRQPQEQTTECYQLVIQAFLNPQKLAKCSTFAECGWGCIDNMIEACTDKKHRKQNACKNKPVVNMLFQNKLILDNNQNTK